MKIRNIVILWIITLAIVVYIFSLNICYDSLSKENVREYKCSPLYTIMPFQMVIFMGIFSVMFIIMIIFLKHHHVRLKRIKEEKKLVMTSNVIYQNKENERTITPAKPVTKKSIKKTKKKSKSKKKN